jgi:hypothetical protein
MANILSVGSVIHETSAIFSMSEVSAFRVVEAESSTLLADTGFVESDVIANITAIVVPATYSVVDHLPVTSGHVCHRHGRNEEENRQNKRRDLHPVNNHNQLNR